MSYSADLLEQATGLCAADARRPKQVNLRRSISAAYYAVFHQLIEDAVRLLLPARCEELRHQLARKFAHKTIKSISQATAKDAATPADLAYVASAFVTLQEARHQADYDFSVFFTKAEASSHIDLARDAIRRWASISSSVHAERYKVEMLVGRLES